MANDIRSDFDEIALRLEAQGETMLASVIDLCSAEIHTRMARAQRRPKPRMAQVSTVSVAGDALAQIRWARSELRDLSRAYRKHGSVAEARDLLKLASDLSYDEQAIESGSDEYVLPWEAPADESGDEGGGEAVVDIDGPVEFPEGEDEPSDDAESMEFSDEEAADEGDTGEVSTDIEDQVEPTEEEIEASLPPINTMEACLKEVRVLARMARRANNIKTAAGLTRWAMFIEASIAEAGDEAIVIPMPESDGEDGIIDSTNFDFGDDDIVNFALEVEQDSLGEPAGDEGTDFSDDDDGDETIEVTDEAEDDMPYEGGDEIADLDDADEGESLEVSDDESGDDDAAGDDEVVSDEADEDAEIEARAAKYDSAARTVEATRKLVAKHGYPAEVKRLADKAVSYRKQASMIRAKKSTR